MCCLEIKTFGIIRVTLNVKIESRAGCFACIQDNDRVREGIMTLEIIKPLKSLITFNVFILCFSKDVLVIV